MNTVREQRRLLLKKLGEDGHTVVSDGHSLNVLLRSRMRDLEEAMIECNTRLNTMSMALTGYERSRICIANNFLNEALGRASHFVADNYAEEK